MSERIRISAKAAKAMMDQGEASFLDVIDSHSYDDFDSQIEGAIRIKPEKIGDQYQRLPKEKTVVAY